MRTSFPLIPMKLLTRTPMELGTMATCSPRTPLRVVTVIQMEWAIMQTWMTTTMGWRILRTPFQMTPRRARIVTGMGMGIILTAFPISSPG